MSQDQARQYEYKEIYLPMVELIAQSQDLTMEDLYEHLPRVRLNFTPRDWQRWLAQTQDAAKAVADQKEKAGRPRVTVPDTRPQGGGGGGSEFDRYIKDMREGKPLQSPAEIDRITAGRYRE